MARWIGGGAGWVRLNDVAGEEEDLENALCQKAQAPNQSSATKW